MRNKRLGTDWEKTGADFEKLEFHGREAASAFEHRPEVDKFKPEKANHHVEAAEGRAEPPRHLFFRFPEVFSARKKRN